MSARPGSGKTATAKAIAQDDPSKQILLLTFSRTLANETNAQLKDNHPNCRAMTFHEGGTHLVGTVVFNDSELQKHRMMVLDRVRKLLWDCEPFDVIILDEFQDCSDSILWLVNHIILINNRKKGGDPAKLVVLGDERQSIFRFRGADSRYLTFAPKLLHPFSSDGWATLPLDKSFRLPVPSIQFINDVFLGNPYISGSKDGPKPIVLQCSPFNTPALVKNLLPLIKSHGAENTAIIAPSISKSPPIWKLENLLAKRGIKIAVFNEEESSQDKKVTENKLCISSIHRFKGLERDLVILFGIDNSFFKYFGRDLPDDRCPNEIFVALTRAAKQLVLIHNDKEQVMPFMSVDSLYNTADVVNLTRGKAKIPPAPEPGRQPQLGFELYSQIGVRDIASYVRSEYVDDLISSHVHVQKVLPALPLEHHIKMDNIVRTGYRTHESVGDINGLVVAAACEYHLAGTLKTLNCDPKMTKNPISPVDSSEYVPWLCQRSVELQSRITGFQAREMQLKPTKFNWIDPDTLAQVCKRFKELLGNSASGLVFETNLEADFSVDDQTTRIYGRPDIIGFTSDSGKSVETVWELKFVSQLTNQHVVQACGYAYLLGLRSGQVPRTVLINIRNGEKWEITSKNGLEGLRCLIEGILRRKCTTETTMDDESFMEVCNKTTQEVLDVARDDKIHGNVEAK